MLENVSINIINLLLRILTLASFGGRRGSLRGIVLAATSSKRTVCGRPVNKDNILK